MPIDSSKHIYLVGIKGVGMTALAQILKSRGKKINGSDTQEKFFTDQVLKKLKIPFKEGFKAANLSGKIDLVIYSTAFDPKTHPEITAAKKRGIPVVSYPKAVSILFNNSLGIAISGTHGKTTTSALVAESMKNLKFDLTALVGSRVHNWQSNALVSKNKRIPAGENSFFVIEADEHQNKLRFYRPWSIILTNIDYDHPDFYKKESDYYNAFEKWVARWTKAKTTLPGIGIFNGDDPKIKHLIKKLAIKSNNNQIILTYGKGKNVDVKIVNQHRNKITLATRLNKASKKVLLATELIGQHNAYNLAAAYAFVQALSRITHSPRNDTGLPITDAKIAKSFSAFAGTERRMQHKGKKGNVLIFDDYAHHPSEIKAALSAIKESYPRHQLFVIFQPHTYTRTAKFLKGFVKSLKTADQIGLLEIYGSARESEGNVSSRDIQKLIQKSTKKPCLYFTNRENCVKFLKNHDFKKPTVLITMGAGDGWRVGERYLKI